MVAEVRPTFGCALAPSDQRRLTSGRGEALIIKSHADCVPQIPFCNKIHRLPTQLVSLRERDFQEPKRREEARFCVENEQWGNGGLSGLLLMTWFS